MTRVDTKEIIKENTRRRNILFSAYDPITGEGSPIERVPVSYTWQGIRWTYKIPLSMYRENTELIDTLNKQGSIESLLSFLGETSSPDNVSDFAKGFTELRFLHDFEYWGFTCIKIIDKISKLPIPFKLNRPQRRVLARLEKMRLAGEPIRAIILKARQWGGSTLVQIYMAWIQLIHKKNWHSVIVADVENQARNIRGTYTRLAQEYPGSMGAVKLVPYEGSTKTRMIKDRGCIIDVGSMQKPESQRSFDIVMTHMSEVGLWKATAQRSAEDLVQAIRGTIPEVPYSLSVLESTAKGVGNFFHREWQSAVSKESAYDPIFVPWFEIEMYQKPINDYEAFIARIMEDAYAMFLWNLGATLEGINWYFSKKKADNWSDWRMKSEFPSTAEEAFQATGARVFAPEYVKQARKTCIPPVAYGDIYAASQKGKDAFKNLEFKQSPEGLLLVWVYPDATVQMSDRYVVTVDIGGRTKDADWSVIKVFDRYWMSEGGVPEVVACWRGHLDQDLVAWKAAQIAKWYGNALLVVEFNSLTKDNEDSEGDHHLTVLDEIVKYYSRIYARTDPEKVRQGIPIKYGFHTNKSTKPMVIDELNGCLREEAYYERDLRACDEMDTYEVKADGTYGAVDGCHDDLVMVTAIGVWICYKYLPTPKVIVKSSKKSSRGAVLSEASI